MQRSCRRGERLVEVLHVRGVQPIVRRGRSGIVTTRGWGGAARGRGASPRGATRSGRRLQEPGEVARAGESVDREKE